MMSNIMSYTIDLSRYMIHMTLEMRGEGEELCQVIPNAPRSRGIIKAPVHRSKAHERQFVRNVG